MAGNGLRQISTSLDKIAPDHRKRYEYVAQFLLPHERVLDAACGCGYGSYILGEQCESVIAIDRDGDACMFGMAHYNRPNIQYMTGDLATPVFEDAVHNIDLIVSFETIEHVQDAAALLRSFHNKADRLWASVPNESVLPFSPKSFPYHYRHYTADQFGELLVETGWQVEGWYTQDDKWTGDIRDGADGRTLIVECKAIREEAA